MAVFPEAGTTAGPSLDANKLVNIAGAVVSLGLIVGVGVWGYKLVMRDVTGLPVVRAMEGPMRVAPSNPGGEIASNVGLSVNEVAALGGASAPEEAEIVVLAPATTNLTVEDLTAEPVEPVVPEVVAEAPAPAATSVEAVNPEAVGTTQLSADQILAMADQIAAGIAPLTEIEDAPEATPVSMSVNGVPVEVIADIVPSTVPGVAKSLRPALRPANVPAATQASLPAPAAVTTGALVTSDAIPVGTSLVQIGAYNSAAVAAEKWGEFTQKYPDFFADKDRVIQQAERGGTTFFRLRAMNFTDISDARRFCAALSAEGNDCVPVVVR